MNDVKISDLTPVKNTRSDSPSSAPRKDTVPVQESAPEQQAQAAREDQSKTNQLLNQQKIEQQRQELKEAVTKLNDYVQSVQRDLNFEIDESSGRVVVTVTDRQTNEIVRQIPDEVTLKLARKLQEDGETLRLFEMRV